MGAKQGLSPNTYLIIFVNGLPSVCEIPLFTIKEETAINGKSEGISTFMHISIPDSAPSAHSLEKIRSRAHIIIIARERSAAVNL